MYGKTKMNFLGGFKKGGGRLDMIKERTDSICSEEIHSVKSKPSVLVKVDSSIDTPLLTKNHSNSIIDSPPKEKKMIKMLSMKRFTSE